MRGISTKFLMLVGTCVLGLLCFVLHRTYRLACEQAQHHIKEQSHLAMAFTRAIQSYFDHEVRPAMRETGPKDWFVPETMSSSYATRMIFADVNKEFPHLILKLSSADPRNPANKASPQELAVLRKFEQNPDDKDQSSVIKVGGEPFVAYFHPRRMRTECLHCHGDPKAAPAGLVRRYGAVSGFHRPVGTVIGCDTVAIPLRTVHAQLWRGLRESFAISGVGLLVLFVCVLVAFRLMVARRLHAIARHFEGASLSTDHSQLELLTVHSHDEIASLAHSLNGFAGALRKYHFRLKEQVRESAEVNAQLMQQIAERGRAEHELRESEQRVRTILDTIQTGIVVVDPVEHRVVDVNRAAAQLIGAEPQQIVNRGCRGFVCNLDACPAMDTELQIRNVECQLTTADGQTVPIRKTIVSIVLDQREHLLECFEDLSAVKQAERERTRLHSQLQQSQKMEAIGRLAGGVAHDFNNLLTLILGYGEDALATISTDDPLHTPFHEIVEAGRRAASLTKQLLAFSRRQLLEFKLLDINTVVTQMGRMLQRMIGEDVRLVIDSRQSLSPVLADRGQIEQILMNLAINARDAMPSGGELVIQTGEDELDTRCDTCRSGLAAGRYVLLTVVDTGLGMSEEVQRQVFEPFFTTKERGRGTGLGLSTVYGVMKQHDGHLELASTLGEGTVFRMYFPVAKENSKRVRQTGIYPPAKGRESIMVVEDEEAIRRFVVNTLRPLGYAVWDAASGGEALELMKNLQGDVDLMLTDVIMPGMNGREVGEEVKQRFPRVKVVYMSGYLDETLSRHGMQDAGSAILFKPLTARKITAKLREVLDLPIDLPGRS